MSKAIVTIRINTLFQGAQWAKARQLLEREREKAPMDHWVLTQLGVTYYEERLYKEALALFERSRELVLDCPLTLWNLAGTIDVLGLHAEALEIYSGLLRSKHSSKDDP